MVSTLQQLITLPDYTGLLLRFGSVILVYLTVATFVNVSRVVWQVLPRLNPVNIILLIIFWVCLEIARPIISDALIYFEPPVYDVAFSPDNARLYALQKRLSENLLPGEFQYIDNRVDSIAAKIGSSKEIIYSIWLCECGLNPFIIRKDRIAAGPIQHTQIGLSNIVCRGKYYSLDEVINACERRDKELIMDLCESYCLHWHKQTGKDFNTPLVFYQCLFKPSDIGAGCDKVAYSGYNNASYYLNAGFDGYELKGDRITKSAYKKDGVILWDEVRMHIEFTISKNLK